MRKELAFALKTTIPVACGYIFLGMAFGILLSNAGYGLVWALLSSVFVYAGSMQFVMVALLASAAPLLAVAVTTFLVNARHIFYGLGFIERFRKMGAKFPYMVLSLTDETYSVLCSVQYPAGLSEDRCALFISLFDQLYWVLGSVLGAAAGQLIPFDMTGVDFAMTALFVVIFVDQWKQYPSHIPAVTGAVCAAASLLLFGPANFLPIALAAAVGVLIALRGKLEGNA
ncbi:MAG: branched-chain amino acid ABC transporter permease [Clostridiales bacterium]|nr:branched-chain amino acid ABC transporter permease [Clostridiales bacterium]